MAHWAELDHDNVVVNVVVMNVVVMDDPGTGKPPAGIAAHGVLEGSTWQRTYYATDGHNFAGAGMRWVPKLANFVAPKPYASWVLGDDGCWHAPVPCPGDLYSWNEAKGQWVPMPVPGRA